MESPSRPYRRAIERVIYRMPVEVTNFAGDFVIRATLCDVSALAARVEFLRPPRLRLGDPVVLNLSRNFNVEGLKSTFHIHARVLMRRTPVQLVLMFVDPRFLVQEGFVRYVYGPMLKAAASTAPRVEPEEAPRRPVRPRRPLPTLETAEEDSGAAHRSLRWRSAGHSLHQRDRRR